MKINPQKESEIRISANEEFKEILVSLFPRDHVCARKIGNFIPGAFPYEYIPIIHRHLKRHQAIQAREKMQRWLVTNFSHSETSDTEKRFAEMQVRRLLTVLNK
ncbi:TPA: hypothetical protein ROG05_004543 [Enterobacter soli]|nr:hypothetical protein [Enterobacter soli]